ncbi:MAG TPA: hypothetical protein ENN56_03255 [Firmicutes bacterium]|nr:hypothetical protein [Bacillota bacterium]
MKIFSLRDLRPNTDRRSFFTDGSPLAEGVNHFNVADVVFLNRGETWSAQPATGAERAVVVMQGSGRMTIDGVEHPVRAFDVIVIQSGEEWSIRGDDVDPAVILVLGAGA